MKSEGAASLFAILMVAMLFSFGRSWIQTGETNEDTITDYLNQIKEGVVAVYPNSVTDNDMDYFVTTEANETYFITVSEHDSFYTHTEVKLSEDTQDLSDMKEASLNAAISKGNK